MRHRTLRGTGPALVAIAIGFGLGGCVEPARDRDGSSRANADLAAPHGKLLQLPCLVPTDYLSGEPWVMCLLGEKEAAEALSKPITLREGEYSLDALSREISRASGKAVLWKPAVARRTKGSILDHFQVSEQAQSGLHIPVKARLGDVLGNVAAMVTEVGFQPDPSVVGETRERPNDYPVWVVFLTGNAVIFAELPAGEH